mgnify:FL=1
MFIVIVLKYIFFFKNDLFFAKIRMNMGIIEIEDMEFYAFHGCFESEKIVGNTFLVQAQLHTNCSVPAQTDNIADALNYQTVYEIIEKQMSIPSSLLEHVCKRILDALFAQFPDQLAKARITVAKLAPPMGGKIKSVKVTMQAANSEL